jgi:hypothetical protein
MSTTSPNFAFVLATTSDTVSVTSHISNNFSSVDSILSAVHTGTGQLRPSISITTPVLINPVLSGTISGGAFVSASTGNFSTITATGGALTVNALSVGTYGYPAAIGSTSTILTVVTGNAVWAAASPNTGANQALSNLASVVINTNLNTFTAGLVTMARVIATSGSLTGLTAFQASTGTFIGNVVISGTATINTINCTGGSITAGGITIGTYAMPSTLGSSGQILKVLSSTLSFNTPVSTAVVSMIGGSFSTAHGGINTIGGYTTIYDPGANVTTNQTYTTPSSGLYSIAVCGSPLVYAATTASGQVTFVLNIGTTAHSMGTYRLVNGLAAGPSFSIIRNISSGVAITIAGTASGVGGGSAIEGTSFSFSAYKMFEV